MSANIFQKVASFLITALLCVGARGCAPRVLARAFPSALGDRQFWRLTKMLSEPGGTFPAENFVSNERSYPTIMPGLLERVTPGRGVYLGVGPEQNLTYIAALRPQAAFIVDVRPGNFDEHLLYKALMEMSATRAEFLGRLFSRPSPGPLPADASPADLFDAYERMAPSTTLYTENLRAVTMWLTRRHGWRLPAADLAGIAHVYHDAFFAHGPDLDYSIGAGAAGGDAPSYRDLMLATDEDGRNRGFLASEDAYAFVRRLEARNLVIPVVGDFSGPTAIRAIGRYVRRQGATVTAFYLSNVEEYLARAGTWGDFCANVSTLPLDDSSTFIYSGRGAPNTVARPPARGPAASGGLALRIRPIRRDLLLCSSVQPPATR